MVSDSYSEFGICLFDEKNIKSIILVDDVPCWLLNIPKAHPRTIKHTLNGPNYVEIPY